MLAGGGAATGLAIASKVGPTELPQTVAAFHSLVGIAAAATAIGEFIAHGDTMGAGSLVATFLATFVGGVTATGSLIAFLKLNGNLGSAPLQLPGRDLINVGLSGTSVALGAFMYYLSTTGSTGTGLDTAQAGLTALVSIAGMSSLLGAHLTASIGGADMPVVITILNSYSGWALCAEGFLLDSPVLTSVGALIGFSGAILTKIMCDAMNRDVVAVVFGTTENKNKMLPSSSTTAAPSAEASLAPKDFNKWDVVAAAVALKEARSVIIVPGYGLAVAKVGR